MFEATEFLRTAACHFGSSLVPLMPETRFENLTHLSIFGPFKVSGQPRTLAM